MRISPREEQASERPESYTRKQLFQIRLNRQLACVVFVIASLNSLAAFSARGREPDPAVTVRVLNYAGAKTSVLVAAERAAGQILQDAGVEVIWFNCRLDASSDSSIDPCRQPLSPSEVVLRMLTNDNRRGITDDAFGSAVPPVLASIYYEQALWLATRTGYILHHLVGCVMAHELGHLLLGPGSHAESGIMKRHWGAKELRLMDWSGLHFTPQQAKLIRAEAEARMGRDSKDIVAANPIDYDRTW